MTLTTLCDFFFIIPYKEISNMSEDIRKQRKKIMEILEFALNHMKDCQFAQAKDDFLQAKIFLQQCKDKEKMFLPKELNFFNSLGFCYCFIMDLQNVKDVTKEEFKKEDSNIKDELDDLCKKYPKRHFPLFLRLLYSFKKECWREALYFCEKIRNFEVSEEEEKKYKDEPMFSKNLVVELDIEYCNEAVQSIEEASIFGLVEKIAKIDDPQNQRNNLPGLNWTKLWSKDFNDKIIKRLRSYKKPMNPLQLHKLFHSEVLPRFYSITSNVDKTKYYYYKKEYMYQCEECLRAKLQHESKKELMQSLMGDSDDDEDYFDDDDDDEDEDDEDDFSDEDFKKTIESDQNKKEETSDKKDQVCDCKCGHDQVNKSENKKEEKGRIATHIGKDIKKVEKDIKKLEKDIKQVQKDNSKKPMRGAQTQTDKIKYVQKYVQADIAIKKKSASVQTDPLKVNKKLEKHEVELLPMKTSKCTKCESNDKLLLVLDEIKSKVLDEVKCKVLDEIKSKIGKSNTEIKESLRDQLNGLIKKIRDEKISTFKLDKIDMETLKGKEDNFQIKYLQEHLEQIEKAKQTIVEQFEVERKNLVEKNILLQKLLIDQVNDKYIMHRNTYFGLENNCKVIIANVSELQNLLTNSTIPTMKENQVYLNRWEKTLSELQQKHGKLKSIYKQMKAQMIHLSNFESEDWPDLSEIPIEAFTYLFEKLKESIRQSAVSEQTKSQNLSNSLPQTSHAVSTSIQNQSMQMQNPLQTFSQPSSVYQVGLPGYMQQSIRPFVQSVPQLRYSMYQQPIAPPPQPIAPPQSRFIPSQPTMTPQRSMAPPPPIPMPKSYNFQQPTCPISVSQATVNAQKNDVDYFYNLYNGKSIYNSISSNKINGDSFLENDKHSNLGHSQNSDKVLKNEHEVNGELSAQVGSYRELNQTPKCDNLKDSNPSSVSSSLENICSNFTTGSFQRSKALPKLINICKDEVTLKNGQEEKNRKCNGQKELIQYIRSNCGDVDSEDLEVNIFKVLKKYDSTSNLSKNDILKEVRSLILSTKHGVWISPKSPLVAWENDHSDSQCTICFDDLNSKPKCELRCKHEYHNDCIKQWLKTSSICPICRVHSVMDEEFPPLI